MEPENTPLEKDNHLPNHHFQVLRQSSGVYPLISPCTSWISKVDACTERCFDVMRGCGGGGLLVGPF